MLWTFSVWVSLCELCVQSRMNTVIRLSRIFSGALLFLKKSKTFLVIVLHTQAKTTKLTTLTLHHPAKESSKIWLIVLPRRGGGRCSYNFAYKLHPKNFSRPGVHIHPLVMPVNTVILHCTCMCYFAVDSVPHSPHVCHKDNVKSSVHVYGTIGLIVNTCVHYSIRTWSADGILVFFGNKYNSVFRCENPGFWV